MEGSTVDVNSESGLWDCEVGNRDRCIDWDWDLPLGVKAMLLEQAQELILERRTDACRIGFKPRPRIIDVTGFGWTSYRRIPR
jgi:hypothetical protein